MGLMRSSSKFLAARLRAGKLQRTESAAIHRNACGSIRNQGASYLGVLIIRILLFRVLY